MSDGMGLDGSWNTLTTRAPLGGAKNLLTMNMNVDVVIAALQKFQLH